MAGEWLKFEKATPDKPEVFAIAARLDIDPDAVVGKLIRVWSWFDTHTVDGNGRGVTAALLDRIATVTGFTRAMEAEGWLVVTPCGVSLPNFDRHTGETAKGRALGAKRSAEHRAKSNAPTVTEGVTPALPREEKKREELNQEQELTALPSAPPPADPQPKAKKGNRLPADWTLPDDWAAWAKQERPDLHPAAVAARFADHWHAKAGKDGVKLDWQATWRNWVRNEKTASVGGWQRPAEPRRIDTPEETRKRMSEIAPRRVSDPQTVSAALAEGMAMLRRGAPE